MSEALPHSLDAERAVLGAPLVAPRLVPELAGTLEADDFFLPAHREIFEAFGALVARDQPADVLLLAEELRRRERLKMLEGGESYLLGLANVTPDTGNFGHYARVVRDKATLRRLVLEATDIANAARTEDGDAAALVSEASEKITALALRRVTQRKLAPIAADVEAVLGEIEARQARGTALIGISTGIDALDRHLGGLRRKNKYEIAARPGIGKTAFAMGIARRHAQTPKAAVLVFSLEMPKDQLIERLICSAGDVDSATLRSGQIPYATWKNNIHPAARDLSNLPIVIVDDVFTIGELEATAHRWRAAHPEDECLIVIDYLQLFDVRRAKGESTSDAVGAVSKRTKRLAKKLDLPVVELSQLNRDSEKEERPPRLSDLRASGDIEQDADAVIFIHDPMPKNDAGERERTVDGPVDLLLGKNRHGATGRARARWIARFYSFTDLAPRSAPAMNNDEDERRYP